MPDAFAQRLRCVAETTFPLPRAFNFQCFAEWWRLDTVSDAGGKRWRLRKNIVGDHRVIGPQRRTSHWAVPKDLFFGEGG